MGGVFQTSASTPVPIFTKSDPCAIHMFQGMAKYDTC